MTSAEEKREEVFSVMKLRFSHIAILVCLTVLILAGGFRVNALASSARSLSTDHYGSIQIHSGDSLWSIAASHCGSEENRVIRSYVDELCRINHMEAEQTLVPGAYLVIRLE